MCIEAFPGSRYSDAERRETGAWNQKSTAMDRSYSSSVSPMKVLRSSGWGDAALNPMAHYCPAQGALLPHKKIRAFVFPKVLQLHTGEVLNIVDAIEYVKQRQVRIPLINIKYAQSMCPNN